jgi:hypothetical protein
MQGCSLHLVKHAGEGITEIGAALSYHLAWALVLIMPSPLCSTLW